MHSGAHLYDRPVAVSRADLNRQVLEPHDRKHSRLGAAQALVRLLIAPLGPGLAAADIRYRVPVPDDVLRYAPFAALHDGEHYLIESYALAVATPCREALECR